jgi:hypothetical protein
MRNLILAVLFLTSTIALADDKKTKKPQRPQVEHGERAHHPPPHVRGSEHHGAKQYHRPLYHQYYSRNPVGYRPYIQWLPSGFSLNIGRTAVSPDRRHVRFGISAGFYGRAPFTPYYHRHHR